MDFRLVVDLPWQIKDNYAQRMRKARDEPTSRGCVPWNSLRADKCQRK